MKNISRSFTLAISSLFVLTQFGCSTPTTSPSNIPVSPKANTTTTVTKVNPAPTAAVVTKQKSFLLTQKNSKGISNPVVPEDIKSITVNGKVFTAADIAIAKNKTTFKTKALDNITLSFVNGQFVIDTGSTDDIALNVTFDIEGITSAIDIPESITGLSGNSLRAELVKNEQGFITGFTGGVNNNGVIDTNNSVFTYNFASQSVTIVSPSGTQTTYGISNVNSDIKVTTKLNETELTPEDAQTIVESTSGDVAQPTPASPFVGKWKFAALNYSFNITMAESATNIMSFNSTFSNTAINFKTSFIGDSKYTTGSSVNVLNLSSRVGTSKLKGVVELQGDNSLVLSLTETDLPEFQSFLNLPLTLERDTL